MRSTFARGAVMVLAGVTLVGCQSGTGSRWSWKKDKSENSALAAMPKGDPTLPSSSSPPGSAAAAANTKPPASATAGVSAPSANTMAAAGTSYPEQSAASGYPSTPYPTTSIPTYGGAGGANPSSYMQVTNPPASTSTPQSGPYAGSYNMPPQSNPSSYSDPYAAGGAQAAGGYGQGGYGQSAPAGGYGASQPAADAGGYRTADATGGRYGNTSPGGYNTGSQYETSNNNSPYGGPGGSADRYNNGQIDRYTNPASGDYGGATGGAPQVGAQAGQTPGGSAHPSETGTGNYSNTNGPYQPGNTNYTPGVTGYNPPGASGYQSATGGAVQTADRKDPFYRPGGTTDYKPAGNVAGPATPGAPAYGSSYSGNSAPANYSNPYAQPAAVAEPSGGYGGTSSSMNRYDSMPPR